MRAKLISLLLGFCVLTAVACRRQEHRPVEAPPSIEACVDRWLQERSLDPFGHAEGTMYAGGTPLFDERTGEQRDRLEYVFGRHPDARTACAPGGAAPVDAGTSVR